GSVRIPAGQSYADLVLRVHDDDVLEPEESVVVTLVRGNGYDLPNGPLNAAVAFIEDDDAFPVLSIAALDDRAAENPTSDTASFRITRTGSLAKSLNVRLDHGYYRPNSPPRLPSPGIDFVPLRMVTIPPG